MYGKPAMTFLKYQMYLYGSEAISYLNTMYFERLQRSSTLSNQSSPTLPLQAATPPYGSITFTYLLREL
jgi:hypothetical protein